MSQPEPAYDYPRWRYDQQQHHARFKRYVEANGVPCQACGGRGESIGWGWYDPPEPCGWCETTGKMTRRLRGQFLTYMRSLKRKRPAPAKERL